MFSIKSTVVFFAADIKQTDRFALAENARNRKLENEIEREKEIRKEQDKAIVMLEQEIKQMQEKQNLMETEMRQLHADKEEDRNLVKYLQEKFSSLQQQHEQFHQ